MSQAIQQDRDQTTEEMAKELSGALNFIQWHVPGVAVFEFSLIIKKYLARHDARVVAETLKLAAAERQWAPDTAPASTALGGKNITYTPANITTISSGANPRSPYPVWDA